MMEFYSPIRDFNPDTDWWELSARRPGLGEFLGANVRQGYAAGVVPSLGARAREEMAAEADERPMSREEWESSGFARPGLTWDSRMTRGRAAAMAAEADERRYREEIIRRREAGLGEAILGFGAQLLGGIPQPENFVPFAGPVARGLRALGAVRAAETLTAPGVMSGALRGAVEGTLGNVAVMPITLPIAERYGDDVTFGRVVGELAIGALIGAGFGAAGGLLARGAETRIAPDTMAAVRTVDVMARDMAAGRAMEVPRAAVRELEEAIESSAPPSLRGVPLRDLPTTPDGLPLSRAEFAAWQERERLTRPVTLDDLDARDLAEGRSSPGALSIEELLKHPARARPRGEKTLTQFVVEQGGIRDDGGELRNLLGGARRPGLINRNGLPADLMAEKARAAGYFDDFGSEYDEFGRPLRAVGEDGFGIVAFWKALEEDFTKVRVRYGRTYDAEGRARQAALADLDEYLSRFRPGLSILSPVDDILRALREVDENAPSRTLEDLIRADQDYAWYREALGAREQIRRLETSAAEPSVAPRDMAQPEARAPIATDDDMNAALRQIDAMRAEGRLTELDEAILRAGNEEADALDAAARGLKEAGECLLRNLA